MREIVYFQRHCLHGVESSCLVIYHGEEIKVPLLFHRWNCVNFEYSFFTRLISWNSVWIVHLLKMRMLGFLCCPKVNMGVPGLRIRTLPCQDCCDRSSWWEKNYHTNIKRWFFVFVKNHGHVFHIHHPEFAYFFSKSLPIKWPATLWHY